MFQNDSKMWILLVYQLIFFILQSTYIAEAAAEQRSTKYVMSKIAIVQMLRAKALYSIIQCCPAWQLLVHYFIVSLQVANVNLVSNKVLLLLLYSA